MELTAMGGAQGQEQHAREAIHALVLKNLPAIGFDEIAAHDPHQVDGD